jgi:hypothetical protein
MTLNFPRAAETCSGVPSEDSTSTLAPLESNKRAIPLYPGKKSETCNSVTINLSSHLLHTISPQYTGALIHAVDT